MDTVIKNVKTISADNWQETAVGITGGKIVAIGESATGAAREEIDAQGACVLPGAVDLHVHFNEPGRTHWEGFATGSAAAAAGGTTYVAEMPLNSIPSTTSATALSEKLQAVSGQAYTDFGLWGGAVPGNADAIHPLAEQGVMGFKAFMSPSGTSEFPHSDAATLREAMKRIAATGLRLALHAEDPAHFQNSHTRKNQSTNARDWERSRPVEAEVSAVRLAGELAGETGCPITIVHISSPEVLETVLSARAAGVDIRCETCPHYLLLSVEEAGQIGPAAKCAPPLRPKTVVDALARRFVSGHIDTLGSDHSPSPPDLKAGKNFFEAWGGIAGIQHGLLLVLDRYGITDPAVVPQLVRACAETPARQAGLASKGRLQVGMDADLFLFRQLETPRVIAKDELLSRHAESAYLGHQTRLSIDSVWLRGRPVVQGGRICGKPRGRFIKGRAAV